jgi:hypothetical protein
LEEIGRGASHGREEDRVKEETMRHLSLCVAVLALSACTVGGGRSEWESWVGPDRVDDPYDSFQEPPRYSDGVLELQNAMLNGKLSTIVASGPTEFGTGAGFYGNAHFDVIAETPTGVAMAVIDLYSTSIPEGVLDVERFDYDPSETTTVLAIGCAGPEYGSWAVDEPADHGQVEVGAGTLKGHTLISFDFAYPSGRLVGSFEVATTDLAAALSSY